MNLKEYLRKNKKTITRYEFANQIGATKSYVDLLCSNQGRRPGANLALRIVEVTNGDCTLEDLLFNFE